MSSIKVLMCRPTYYGIEYSINPWMDTKNNADQNLSLIQWTQLETIYKNDVGLNVEYIDPQPGLPDMVFTANAGVVVQRLEDPYNVGYKSLFISSNFKYPERKGEEPHYENWFDNYKNGDHYDLMSLRSINFEGAGDALPNGLGLAKLESLMFIGYGFRTEKRVNEYFSEAIMLELTDPYFYHLDTCFCPLGDDKVMYWPGAFSEDARKMIKGSFKHYIEVPEEEAKHFVCNSVPIETDKRNVVMPSGCPKTKKILQKEGWSTHEVDMSEFIKAGGATRCLTLFI